MKEKEIQAEYTLKNCDDVSILAAAYDTFWKPAEQGQRLNMQHLEFADGRIAQIDFPTWKNGYVHVIAQQTPGPAFDINTRFSIQREVDDRALIRYGVTEVRDEIPVSREYKRATIEFQQLPRHELKIRLHVWMPKDKGQGALRPLLPNKTVATVFFDLFTRYLSDNGYLVPEAVKSMGTQIGEHYLKILEAWVQRIEIAILHQLTEKPDEKFVEILKTDIGEGYRYLRLNQGRKKEIWLGASKLPFDLLKSSLEDTLQFLEGTRFCDFTYGKQHGEGTVHVLLSQETLEKNQETNLGAIILRRYPDFVDIEYTMEAGHTVKSKPPTEPAAPEIDNPSNAPWEQIPDHGWDRAALKSWLQGYTAKEINSQINVSEGRIRNRLTELRKEYGEALIPYKQPPKKT